MDNPSQEVYTREQLLAIIGEQRQKMEESLRTVEQPPLAGKEMVLDTDGGKVRVLAYRMDVPERLPLFINLHGSGFVVGHADVDDPFMPGLAEQANVKILNVDYLKAPEHPFPEALNQCYAVLKYAKTHADELGIDPDRIAVGGHSAGGNLSAALCLMDGERRQIGIKAVILDYAPVDVYTDGALKPQPEGAIPVETSRFYDACYHIDKEGRKNPLISPLFAAEKHLAAFPPALVITAGQDSLCEEAKRFAGRLMKSGVPVTYQCFATSHHGFTHRPSREAERAWRLMAGFLKMNLGEG